MVGIFFDDATVDVLLFAPSDRMLNTERALFKSKTDFSVVEGS